MSNSELLMKMDHLLSLLVEHTNTHENCCVKNILRKFGDNNRKNVGLGLALTSPHKQSLYSNKGSYCIE